MLAHRTRFRLGECDTLTYGVRTQFTNILGRNGQPEDVAKLVSFLVSDDAAFITGKWPDLLGPTRALFDETAILVNARRAIGESLPCP